MIWKIEVQVCKLALSHIIVEDVDTFDNWKGSLSASLLLVNRAIGGTLDGQLDLLGQLLFPHLCVAFGE